MSSDKAPSLYSRADWIAQCRFEQAGEEKVLDEVASRLDQAKKEGTLPAVVVFDLDSTLYEVAPRTHAIIKEWILSGHALPKHVFDALLGLKHEEVGYSLKDTFAVVGLSLTDPDVHGAWIVLKDYWWDRFFSSEYLKHDKPYAGAARFVNKLYDLGANIVYLTGRDDKKMRKGTLENLERDGFPLDPKRTTLFLKTNPALVDAEYKKQAALNIAKLGNVIASFENEPQNLVVLFETFPKALHIFMETICSDQPAKPIQGLYRIRSFDYGGN